MKKSIFQAVITSIIFFGAWIGLSQINWVSVFKIKQVTDQTDQKLGDLFWDVFKNSEKEITNKTVVNSIDSIVTHICISNKIERDKIRLHVIEKDEINAFALPNGHLVVYSGLILNSDNQEELTGVLCHEIAHIELNHVMKKLVKEIGLTVLISMTSGQVGTETIKETAKMLSSSAFERGLEKEADITAVTYLINSNINPKPFANFLFKLSETEQNMPKYLTWISTHPDSKERSAYILECIKDKSIQYNSILSQNTWDIMKLELKD